jgi:hypothetical protein
MMPAAPDPAKPATWTPEQTTVAQQRPRALAAALAVTCSDLPGFDNADRAYMRRVALALMHGDGDEALTIALQAVNARASCGATRARPEAVILEAVLWLLAQVTTAEPAAAGGAAH